MFDKKVLLEKYNENLKIQMHDIDTLKNDIEELTMRLNEQQITLNKFSAFVDKQEKEEKRKRAKYDSDEPWVEMKNVVDSENGGIKMEMDWNDAFIKHLRSNGFAGENDDILIQQYISVMSQQIAVDMSDDNVEPEPEPLTE